MKVVLTTLNAKYIHKNLALRWLYVSRIPEAEVELMEFVIKDDLERISDQIAQRQPEVIGISVYIWNADLTRKWIAILKRKLPHVRILIGGPEVSYQCEDWLEDVYKRQRLGFAADRGADSGSFPQASYSDVF